MIAKTILAVLLSALLIGLSPNEKPPAPLHSVAAQTPQQVAQTATSPADEKQPIPQQPSPETVKPTEPEPQPTQAKEVVQATQPLSPVEAVRQRAAQKGWMGTEWESLYQLIHNESSWNIHAYNQDSGACGLFQALPCSKIQNPQNIESQMDFGFAYIEQRYGTPSNALASWNARYPHWY
jgi:hypothetical protein